MSRAGYIEILVQLLLVQWLRRDLLVSLSGHP